jgi:hypothetical protein
MRWFAGAVAILPALLIVIGAVTGAEEPQKHSILESTGIKRMLGWPPNGADVLWGLHQFYVFQRHVAVLADQRGDDVVRRFAVEQSARAGERIGRIAALRSFAVLGIDLPDRPSIRRVSALAGLQGAVGQDFIERFHQAQRSEFDRTILLLRRYLFAPDNDPIQRFASEQLIALDTERGSLDDNRDSVASE